jgi:hypothetical protein
LDWTFGTLVTYSSPASVSIRRAHSGQERQGRWRAVAGGRRVTVEAEILDLASDMEALLPRFRNSTSGMFLSTEDQATFKRLALEAKGAIDVALGPGNDFSLNLISTINEGSGGFISGPSYAAVSESAQILRGVINQSRRRTLSGSSAKAKTKSPYVDPSRISDLRDIKSPQWDYARLVQMCVEINAAHESESYITIAMLARAIVDHIPPIFGQPNFSGVANNYTGATSLKKSVQHLDKSLRNIADGQLHIQIRRQESLPNAAQVNFSSDLDVLLAEIIRISR